MGVDELAQSAVAVDVEVVPDQDDGFAELLVGCEQQISVVGPGEAAASAGLVVEMDDRPVDQS